MKSFAFCAAALALCLAACGKQESTAPAPAASEEAAPPAAESSPARFDAAFIEHMHAHADQLDELMFALADEDLDAAQTPAYWLSRHEAVTGVPHEWQTYVQGMRDGARAVESATDLETAQAAAHDISAQCQGCHEAAGVATSNNGD